MFKLIRFHILMLIMYRVKYACYCFDIPKNMKMYPGTKWCGPGNISNYYNDLGEDKLTDICCRNHDYCPDYIEANGTKYGLRNTAPYTRVLCDCDEDFYKCLKKNVREESSTGSAAVGYIYFNQLDTKCFMNEYPIVECKKYTRKRSHCEEYVLNASAPKQYQWFDLPYF